jgi:hypothetical protein
MKTNMVEVEAEAEDSASSHTQPFLVLLIWSKPAAPVQSNAIQCNTV